jgi:hypothetical protein
MAADAPIAPLTEGAHTARQVRPYQAATTLLAILVCLSTACTAIRPITADASGEQVRLELKSGDTVQVLTKSGASHSFQVTIGATSLVGNAVKISGGGSDAVGAESTCLMRISRTSTSGEWRA